MPRMRPPFASLDPLARRRGQPGCPLHRPHGHIGESHEDRVPFRRVGHLVSPLPLAVLRDPLRDRRAELRERASGVLDGSAPARLCGLSNGGSEAIHGGALQSLEEVQARLRVCKAKRAPASRGMSEHGNIGEVISVRYRMSDS